MGGPRPYPTVGASGGVYGLLLAFGMYFPHRRVLLLIPPIPMPARVFVIVFAVLELVFGRHRHRRRRRALRAPRRHARRLADDPVPAPRVGTRRQRFRTARKLHEALRKESSMPVRRLLAAALIAAVCPAALAQDPAVPPAVSVQRLAPQLVSFAGSEANFQSLVNGLANGTQVQLFTVLPNGFLQNVTFTPSAALSALQVAQILETTRQQLIGLGIGAPTAEQLGFALMGGVVPTALGGTQVPGALNAQSPRNLPSPAAQLQGQASAGATAPGTTGTSTSTSPTPGVTNSVNVQTTPGAVGTTTGASATLPRPNTSDSAIPAGATSRSVAPLTSASPTVNTSASPLATTPVQTPAIAPAPRATTERVPAGARPARN